MKRFFLFLIASFFGPVSFGQSVFSSLPVKEHFDKLHFDVYHTRYDMDHLATFGQDDIADILGDAWSTIAEAYIRMYKTTGDKGYLVRFANEALLALETRGDVLGYSQSPIWTSQSMYQDGMIIWPMAHFWHLVHTEEPSLGAEAIPQIGRISSNSFGQNFNTWYDFGFWLRGRIETTLDFYTYPPTNHWVDDDYCYTNAINPQNPQSAELNKQFAWGNSLLYLGITNPNQDYKNKADILADNSFGTYRLEHPPCIDLFYSSEDIMGDFMGNNTRIYHSNGWQKIHCPDIPGTDIEDISHASTSLQYVWSLYNTYNEHSIHTFDTPEMIQFHNTVSLNIIDAHPDACPDIHPGMDGDDVIDYNSNMNGLNNVNIRNSIMSYMPFHQFDNVGAGPSVYTNIMWFYFCNIHPDDSSIPLHGGYAGIADVVQAQWQKECVNLSLYKRDLTYNQDFTVKNKLIVEPESVHPYNTSISFTDPIISTATFTIENNVRSVMTAGEAIILRPGFSAKAGCDFKAAIAPGICTDGLRTGNPEPNPEPPAVPASHSPAKPSAAVGSALNVSVFPNPTSGQITVKKSTTAVAKLSIVDALGQTVYSSIFSGDTEQIDFSGYDAGLYCVLVESEGNHFIHHIVLKK